ncbi:MAG: glycogen synthase [Alphaproteobacteria bacterium]|nr:MAG: glycogen synthase [Alphaproteobacteria bacterium]
MRVLAATSEIYPLVKTGGLADVAGALPLALARSGIETRTVVPGYRAVMAAARGRKVAAWEHLFGGPARLVAAEAAGLQLYVVDAPHLFDRQGGLYVDASGQDWPDNWQRFAALSRVTAEIAGGLIKGWRPDLVHVHDWQAALAPAYMRHGAAPAMLSIVTVHNLAFQGRFPAAIFAGLGLPDAAFSLDGVEYYGGVGFLKAGLQAASAITTVSPTYAQEIRTPEFGMGLDGLINARAADLHGIVNGIDTEEWNPKTDRHLAANYGPGRLGARNRNAAALAGEFDLDADHSPLLAVISRLTWQKGMDVLAESIDAIVAAGARLALLGSGDAAIEGELLAAVPRHRGRVGVRIGYDEALSHLLQGGADAILVPSRFEPCGLTQLYGLRYGCIPIVARTGGLADTVVDANHAALDAGCATGFQFAAAERGQLVATVARAIAVHRDAGAWARMQRRAMKADVSWDKSAAQYAELYRRLIGENDKTP